MTNYPSSCKSNTRKTKMEEKNVALASRLCTMALHEWDPNRPAETANNNSVKETKKDLEKTVTSSNRRTLAPPGNKIEFNISVKIKGKTEDGTGNSSQEVSQEKETEIQSRDKNTCLQQQAMNFPKEKPPPQPSDAVAAYPSASLLKLIERTSQQDKIKAPSTIKRASKEKIRSANKYARHETSSPICKPGPKAKQLKGPSTLPVPKKLDKKDYRFSDNQTSERVSATRPRRGTRIHGACFDTQLLRGRDHDDKSLEKIYPLEPWRKVNHKATKTSSTSRVATSENQSEEKYSQKNGKGGIETRCSSARQAYLSGDKASDNNLQQMVQSATSDFCAGKVQSTNEPLSSRKVGKQGRTNVLKIQGACFTQHTHSPGTTEKPIQKESLTGSIFTPATEKKKGDRMTTKMSTSGKTFGPHSAPGSSNNEKRIQSGAFLRHKQDNRTSNRSKTGSKCMSTRTRATKVKKFPEETHLGIEDKETPYKDFSSLKHEAIARITQCLGSDSSDAREDDPLHKLFGEVLGILGGSQLTDEREAGESRTRELISNASIKPDDDYRRVALRDISQCLESKSDEDDDTVIDLLLFTKATLLGTAAKKSSSQNKKIVKKSPAAPTPGPGAYDVSAKLSVAVRGLKQYSYNTVDWNALPDMVGRKNNVPRHLLQDPLKTEEDRFARNISQVESMIASFRNTNPLLKTQFNMVVLVFLCGSWVESFCSLHDCRYISSKGLQALGEQIYRLYCNASTENSTVNWSEARQVGLTLSKLFSEVPTQAKPEDPSQFMYPTLEKRLQEELSVIVRSSQWNQLKSLYHAQQICSMLATFWSYYSSQNVALERFAPEDSSVHSLRHLHNFRQQLSCKSANVPVGLRIHGKKYVQISSGSTHTHARPVVSDEPRRTSRLLRSVGTQTTTTSPEACKTPSNYDYKDEKEPEKRLVELLGPESDYFANLFDSDGHMLVTPEDFERIIRVYTRGSKDIPSYLRQTVSRRVKSKRSEPSSQLMLNVEQSISAIEPRVTGGAFFASEVRSRKRTSAFKTRYSPKRLQLLKTISNKQSKSEFLETVERFGRILRGDKEGMEVPFSRLFQTMDDATFLRIVSTSAQNPLSLFRQYFDTKALRNTFLSHFPRHPSALMGRLPSKEKRRAEERKKKMKATSQEWYWYKSQLHAYSESPTGKAQQMKYGYLKGIGREIPKGGMIKPDEANYEVPDWAIAEAAGISRVLGLTIDSEETPPIKPVNYDFGKRKGPAVAFGKGERFSGEISLPEDMEELGFLQEIENQSSVEGDNIQINVENLHRPTGKIKGGMWPQASELSESDFSEGSEPLTQELKDPWQRDLFMQSKVRNISINNGVRDSQDNFGGELSQASELFELFGSDLSGDSGLRTCKQKDPWQRDSFTQSKARNINLNTHGDDVQQSFGSVEEERIFHTLEEALHASSVYDTTSQHLESTGRESVGKHPGLSVGGRSFGGFSDLAAGFEKNKVARSSISEEGFNDGDKDMVQVFAETQRTESSDVSVEETSNMKEHAINDHSSINMGDFGTISNLQPAFSDSGTSFSRYGLNRSDSDADQPRIFTETGSTRKSDSNSY